MSDPTTPQRWLARAAEARETASAMNDPVAKQTLLGIAASYEKMATYAAALKDKQAPKPD
jgi:hypothetical protein